MSDNKDCKMPEPTPHHAKILEGVGTWDVKTKHFMEPGKPPMEGTAVDKVTAVGGFWTMSRYETSFFGQPFLGHCTLGYDPAKERFVMTWVDSMGPFLFNFEGGFDPSGKTLTMTGQGPDMQGGMTTWKSVTVYQDKDHLVMKMFVNTPGGECQLMENAYTRRK